MTTVSLWQFDAESARAPDSQLSLPWVYLQYISHFHWLIFSSVRESFLLPLYTSHFSFKATSVYASIYRMMVGGKFDMVSFDLDP